ncbi:MAG: hypothetical protein ABI596_01475 [Pyrinomonadaceae bacterium]
MSSAVSAAETEVVPQMLSLERASGQSLSVKALLNEDQAEVLAFLSLRPIHTVCMAGYILDHGVVSAQNRGIFYGCRGADGKLKGVALVGHATLIETQCDDALKAFAQLEHQYSRSHLIRGEHEMIQRFWGYYAKLGHQPRRACRELLFEQQAVPEIKGDIPALRTAMQADLDQVIKINADMIVSECGVDPLVKDGDGFRERVARRIDQGRVWVWSESGRLIFKADVFAETPEMIYLEGINVHGTQRGNGYGTRCLAQLGRILLQRSRSICLLMNERKELLGDFYKKAGYEFRGVYDTIYLHPQ